jgi:uncharacterized SAM-binding protein YcdF (DUF218 family)
MNLYKPGVHVLCTGGWGKHFNTSKEAHAIYAKNYLIEKGVAEEDFLDLAISNNTVDDAVQIKSIISTLGAIKLMVVTSDYHLERVKLIFSEVLMEYDIKFIGAPSSIEKKEIDSLIEHENIAIETIKKNGLYF